MVQLSNYEWKIMNLIWDKEPRTIKQLTEELKEETGWTKYTVITYLKRLEAKGAIHFEEGKRSKLYFSDIKREDTQIQEVDTFLNKVFSGSLGLMINTMIKEEKLSIEEILEFAEQLKNDEGK